MDDVEIIREIVELRESLENKVFLSLLIEGIIGFFAIILCIWFTYFNNVLIGSLMIFSSSLLYGVIMRIRLEQYKKIKKFGITLRNLGA